MSESTREEGPLIVAEELRKRFDGRLAVEDLSFSVAAGEIYGLIGPNGAGKTTTQRMLAGLLQPTSGRAHVCGVDIEREPLRAKAQIGFLTGSTGLYARLTPAELMEYFARLHGLSATDARRRIEILAEQLEIGHLLQRRCGKLSSGEKQRVSLARATVHDPLVLILDEPTASLDVVASRFVADFIRRTRERGRAVLFSTHYMTEAELLCDRVGLIHQGKLLLEGTPAEVRQSRGSLEQAFLDLVGDESPADRSGEG